MAILIRILLRYGAAVLVTKGILAPEVGVSISNDPDVAMAVQVAAGALVGAVSELWYYVAKKLKLPT